MERMTPQEALKLIFEDRFEIYKDGESYISIYKWLITKLAGENGIEHAEYKFLCWLNANDESKFPIKIDKPFIPLISTTIEISENDFKLQYCFNQRRNEAYKLLVDFLLCRKIQFKVDFMDILVGGSFLDKKNESPNDIDAIVTLPEVIFSKFVAKRYDEQMEMQNSITAIDVNYLNAVWTIKNYWYYACLTHLGNDALIKDKQQLNLTSNKFDKRDILRIKMS